MRSGLTVGECLNIIAQESPDPVGPEFRLVNEAIKLGQPMADALQRMSDRLPSPEFRYFTIVLGTQQTTGGNLAETLAKLSDVLRQRKKMRDKVQAMSSEAKASAGIIGSLPLFVMGALSFLAPDYVALLFTHGSRSVHARDLLGGDGLRRDGDAQDDQLRYVTSRRSRNAIVRNFELGFDLPTVIVLVAFIAAFASVMAVATPVPAERQVRGAAQGRRVQA